MRRRREDQPAEVHTWPAPLLPALAAAATATGVSLLDDAPIWIVIVAPAVAVLVMAAIAVEVIVARPFRSKERGLQRRLAAARNELHDEKRERLAVRELERSLDHASSEDDALQIIRSSFERHLADQPMELHLVDAVEPVLSLVVATGDHDTRPGERPSPWDSTAARSGRTLVYDSTDRVDVCPHLKSRLRCPMSAVAVPLTATGRLLGVLYGFAPEFDQPGPGDVEFLEDIASTIAGRIAVLRSGGPPIERDAVDRLTGLPDRATMQDRVVRLLRDRVPFTVAVADVDGFRRLNEQYGREAGDRAIRLVSSVARRSIRPNDILGRIGGDELILVLPRSGPDDATRAIERLREELVLAQSVTEQPGFTLSVGVVGSSCGTSLEEILHRAAEALRHAKSQGGNRVVVAHPATQKR